MSRRIISALFIFLLFLAVLAPSCQPAPEVIKWRMATSWSEDMFFYGEGAVVICDRVAEMSGGRLVIEPYPAGILAGALEVFDAVSKGEVECAHTWPGYWRSKEPAFELFSSIPNQMVLQEWAVWLYGPSRGIELWRELYAGYNAVPFPGGLIGPEFGFFTSQPVRSLEDFKGLKLRVSGMAADVVRELGATAVLLPGGDIKAAMESGEIDGFEFSTPAVDWPMGFQEVAPYVALPSWHQPSAMLETIVNVDAWNRLPDDLKAIFEAACKETGMTDFMAGLEGENAEYLRKFEQSGVKIIMLDAEAINEISRITNRLADEQAAEDAFFARVLESQRDFRQNYRGWEKWGDHNLYRSEHG